ncbi:MAG: response regulator [Candidatus Eisenbacteria bacterium]|nr:response regulator [Candidatus Eisenbacteria bacterium]
MNRERILVVEDESSLRKILQVQLEGAGYQVSTATDGREGLEKILDDPPDLVLMDLMMPRMDGSELCRRMRESFRTSQIPIIMLTARGQLEDKIAGLTVGANDYLTKPYSLDELLVRVRNMLQWSRIQREANPLTGLPGNVMIDTEATRRIQAKEEFAFLYVDIDHFKAFNDYYSYQKGDEAIKLTAGILLRAVARFGSPNDFVGHIGGDDFVLLSTPEHARRVATEIVRDFDERIVQLYNGEDRARGYIEVTNRQNQIMRFPIMSVTVAGITSLGRNLTHVGQLTDMAAELKRYGKSRAGSIVVWERRAD